MYMGGGWRMEETNSWLGLDTPNSFQERPQIEISKLGLYCKN
jgi:hypothetical protein